MSNFLNKAFGLDPAQHNVRTEIVAGITTFLTMAYILAVNPSIFSALDGMPGGAVFTATALAAIVGTLIMAIYAKKPFALAPGMGLNAFFVYTVCLTMGYSWQFALTAVFLEGILFIIMTVTKVRTLLLNAIPGTLKKAIGAGIGIILTTLLGLVIKDPATGMAVTQLAHNDAGALQLLSMPHSIDPIFCKFEFGQILSWDMLVVVFTFLFVDMFDTMGTIIGVHQGAGLIPDDGPRDNVPGAEKMFLADSIATVAGACFGTSTTTTYVESAAGVGEGGRTGLTAFSTAVCFALALFFSPIFLSIPSAATAPALIIVGVMMMPSIKRIHWEDYCKSIPAFITIIMMPVAYSISDGILIGVISYVVTHAIAGRYKEISVPMWVLSVLFVLRYIFI